MVVYQMLAYTIYEKIWKSHTKAMNSKYQLRRGIKNLNYLMDHFLYQLTAINIYLKKQSRHKTNIYIQYLYTWSNFSRSKQARCFIIWRWERSRKLQVIFPSNRRNKKLHCYDQPVKKDLRTYVTFEKLHLLKVMITQLGVF